MGTRREPCFSTLSPLFHPSLMLLSSARCLNVRAERVLRPSRTSALLSRPAVRQPHVRNKALVCVALRQARGAPTWRACVGVICAGIQQPPLLSCIGLRWIASPTQRLLAPFPPHAHSLPLSSHLSDSLREHTHGVAHSGYSDATSGGSTVAYK